MSAYDALRMKTVDAAYCLGWDHLIGSIEAGKYADFTVLKESPLEVAPGRLRDIEVWGTVVGGRPRRATDSSWSLTPGFGQQQPAPSPSPKRPRL